MDDFEKKFFSLLQSLKEQMILYSVSIITKNLHLRN